MEPDHSFKFSSVPPGDYTLIVKAVNAGVTQELGFASVRVVDSNLRANVEVGRAAEVRGRVEAPQGLSLAGKRITLETFGPGFYLLHEAPGIDSGGRFVIPNLPPGEFIFTVSDAQGEQSAYVSKAICDGRDYASAELTLAVRTSLDCDLTLASDTGTIHGKVTTARTLLPGSRSFWSPNQNSCAGFHAIPSPPRPMSAASTESRELFPETICCLPSPRAQTTSISRSIFRSAIPRSPSTSASTPARLKPSI